MRTPSPPRTPRPPRRQTSLGNDVVDLRDPEADLQNLHPRFAERVFTAAECETLQAARRAGGSAAHQALHWALWAAKESAYKALKRMSPEAVFSPRAFEVTLSQRPLGDFGSPVEGTVRYGDHRFTLRVHGNRERIHAIASFAAVARRATAGHAPCAPAEDVLWQVAEATADASASVRRQAITAIADALGLDPAALRVEGRPPRLTLGGQAIVSDLSLSHHGRFAAFACLLPDALEQPLAG